MELIIKGARIVDYKSDFVGDILIRDGIIAELAMEINKPAQIIDGRGLTLMPAFVDLHAHFRDPGLTYKEDIESGSRAAARGGYTTVNLMANTKPVCSNMEIVNYVKSKGQECGLVEVNQLISITKDMDGKDLSHLDELKPEVKDSVIFLSDDGKGVADSKIMMNSMIKARKLGLTIISHAESPELSDVDMRLAENTMTWRDITLSEYTGCKLHLAHVSTKEAMSYVIASKDREGNISCEVTPHHLALVSDAYRVNPPIRNKEDVDFLIYAIQRGYVDCIATDHAPHTQEDKEKGAPGISGIETSFSVVYTSLVKNKLISLNRLSELMSKRPAELMNKNRGKIQIGCEADLVLVDLAKEYEIDSEKFESKGKNTPFNGKKVVGEILYTLRQGKVVYKK